MPGYPKRYDAIVIGAGPAGCMAAYELAAAGARVALVEKHRLPRHKTCGGGMPMVAGDVIGLAGMRRLAPEAFVEADARYMRHTWNFEGAVLAPMNTDEPGERQLSLWMVQRAVFDNALADRAAAAGAELRDGLSVQSVSEDSTAAHVTAAEGTSIWQATADCVIGCDGANGVVARCMGLRRKRAIAIGMEVEAPHDWASGHCDLRPEVCHLEYGAVRHGYAWVFPKRDHVNVGAGVFRARTGDERDSGRMRDELRTAICRYMEALEIPTRGMDLKYHAHPLPLWNGLDRVHSARARVLLAGDAAGLINPLFGDGILHALTSGRVAAQCVLRTETDRYTERISEQFKSNFDAALRLAKFFYTWTPLCYRHAVKRPGATRTAVRLLCGDAVFSDVAARVMRRVRKLARGDRQTGLAVT